MDRSIRTETPVALDFEWSPKVRRQAQDEIATSLAPGQPQRAAQLRLALAARDFVAEFNVLFGSYGLRANHLGDVTTAHWLTMWTVVHDAPFPPAPQIEAVRRQLAGSWNHLPAVRKPHTRQMLAEMMLAEMMVALDEQAQRRASGNAEALQAMARTTAQNMRRKRGINLQMVRIGDAGLVPTH